MEKSPNASPEFEFWMSSNNNNPPSSSFSHPENLLSADELFSDGIILPLNTHPPPPRAGPTTTTNPPPPPAPPTNSSSPKRWKLMFRPSSKEAKRMNGASSANNMELNIHIWPFSRSRSAGNTAGSSSTGSTTNPVRGSPGCKSCSAPCSRSNSHGDSEAATSPTSSATKPATGTAAATTLKKRGQLAGGIYIGRSVPVWQLRAKNHGNNNNGGVKKVNVGINMLNLKNVNTCIGYGSNNVNGQLSGCRVEDKDEVTEGDRSDGDVIRGGSLLKFRAIFSKKVHV